MRTIARSIANRLAEHHRGLPVWIRATKSGQEFYTELSRGKLYELASRGLIRSFSLREPGNLKGCRFFHLQSILEYLERAEQRERKSADDPAFWGLTPSVVLADEQGQTDAARSAASSTLAVPDNPDKPTSDIKTSDCVIKNSSAQIASPDKKTDVHFVPIATGQNASS